MKKTVVVAGVAAAFLVLAPGAALAATTPTATPEAPAEHVGVPKAYVRVMPKIARPGTKVELRVGCDAESTHGLTSPVLTIGALRRTGPQNDPAIAPAAVASAVVKQAKPGVYPVSFFCGGAEISAKFTVLGDSKQVTKVPAGAPQTGGTDGPADDSGGPLAAAAAMGVLAVGGSGLVLARRARRR
ncbi:hypothetical protein OG738_06665 [Amycolatopsis sp. NBC_01488]|uniref:hypothetical protein n=1 Tax=Amycolatopsis sp. NBC_01488 TaxID=2903563 RepID=UPI002E2A307F|nr:hypothetical protein [Amycolatopsis sp. NBC_01488]